MVGKLRE
jgi:hypothetical protein